MGIVVKGNCLGIGGVNMVWEYCNVLAVVVWFELWGKNDVCYLLCYIYIIGDIDIYEMVWVKDDWLWLVNICFGCLCMLDVDYSFYFCWCLLFIFVFVFEDCCYLNGLVMVDGEFCYVIVLGEIDIYVGWWSNKVFGGILMDVVSNKVVLCSLFMFYLFCWYCGKLWVLELG